MQLHSPGHCCQPSRPPTSLTSPPLCSGGSSSKATTPTSYLPLCVFSTSIGLLSGPDAPFLPICPSPSWPFMFCPLLWLNHLMCCLSIPAFIVFSLFYVDFGRPAKWSCLDCRHSACRCAHRVRAFHSAPSAHPCCSRVTCKAGHCTSPVLAFILIELASVHSARTLTTTSLARVATCCCIIAHNLQKASVQSQAVMP